MILDCVGAQCGRQEAWTTVDLALIRGLVPHDQGSSWGFLCLAWISTEQGSANGRGRVSESRESHLRAACYWEWCADRRWLQGSLGVATARRRGACRTCLQRKYARDADFLLIIALVFGMALDTTSGM